MRHSDPTSLGGDNNCNGSIRTTTPTESDEPSSAAPAGTKEYAFSIMNVPHPPGEMFGIHPIFTIKHQKGVPIAYNPALRTTQALLDRAQSKLGPCCPLCLGSVIKEEPQEEPTEKEVVMLESPKKKTHVTPEEPQKKVHTPEQPNEKAHVTPEPLNEKAHVTPEPPNEKAHVTPEEPQKKVHTPEQPNEKAHVTPEPPNEKAHVTPEPPKTNVTSEDLLRPQEKFMVGPANSNTTVTAVTPKEQSIDVSATSSGTIKIERPSVSSASGSDQETESETKSESDTEYQTETETESQTETESESENQTEESGSENDDMYIKISNPRNRKVTNPRVYKPEPMRRPTTRSMVSTCPKLGCKRRSSARKPDTESAPAPKVSKPEARSSKVSESQRSRKNEKHPGKTLLQQHSYSLRKTAKKPRNFYTDCY